MTPVLDVRVTDWIRSRSPPATQHLLPFSVVKDLENQGSDGPRGGKRVEVEIRGRGRLKKGLVLWRTSSLPRQEQERWWTVFTTYIKALRDKAKRISYERLVPPRGSRIFMATEPWDDRIVVESHVGTRSLCDPRTILRVRTRRRSERPSLTDPLSRFLSHKNSKRSTRRNSLKKKKQGHTFEVSVHIVTKIPSHERLKIFRRMLTRKS